MTVTQTVRLSRTSDRDITFQAPTLVDRLRFSPGDRRSVDHTSVPLARRMTQRCLGCSVVSPQSEDEVPHSFTALLIHSPHCPSESGSVEVFPKSGFRVDDYFVASEMLGCEGASPTPQVQFQVLLKLAPVARSASLFQSASCLL